MLGEQTWEKTLAKAEELNAKHPRAKLLYAFLGATKSDKTYKSGFIHHEVTMPVEPELTQAQTITLVQRLRITKHLPNPWTNSYEKRDLYAWNDAIFVIPRLGSLQIACYPKTISKEVVNLIERLRKCPLHAPWEQPSNKELVAIVEKML